MLNGRQVLLFLILAFASAGHATGGVGVTYHGRLLRPDSTPVVSNTVQFRIQVRTPGAENCLMYEEIYTKDLSTSSGTFAITMNDGTATSLNTEPFTFDRIFQNRGTFVFGGGKCTAIGTYTPNPADGRKISVDFNDGSFGGWETLPTQDIAFVPMAVESITVGGFNASSLLRVVDGSGNPATATPLTPAQYTEFGNLLGGTSSQYVLAGGNAAGFSGALAGDVTGTQGSTNVVKLQGRAVDSGLPTNGQVLTWNNGSTRWEASTPVPGGITNLATGTGLSGGPITSTGTISLANTSVSAGGYGSATQVPTFTVDAQGRLTTAANVTIAGVAPGGTASGDLSGTYPSPTIAAASVTGAKIAANTIGVGNLSTTGAATGQTYRYSGAAWTISKLLYTDMVNSFAGTPWPTTTCSSGEFIIWQSTTDSFVCSALTGAQIISALGYTPANGGSYVAKAGDTMTGALVLPSNGLTVGTSELRVVGGNVGIGTTAPASVLNVVSSSSASIPLLVENYFSSPNVSGLVGRVARGTPASPTATQAGDGVGVVQTTYGGSTWANNAAIYARAFENQSEITRGSYIALDTTSSGTTSRVERMRVDHNGNVGLGTTTPNRILEVQKADGTAAALGAGTAAIRIVNNSSLADSLTELQFGNNQVANSLYAAVSGIYKNGTANTAGDLAFSTRGLASDPTLTERMRILSNGNIGIGTNAPTTALEVNGIVKATSFVGTMVSSGSSNTASYTLDSDTDSSGSDGGIALKVRGATKLAVTDSGRIAVGGATTPPSLMANTNTNTSDAAGTGSSTDSLTWLTSAAGYVQTLTNTSAAATANGLFVKTTGTAATNRILDLNANGTDVMTVTGQGYVGLGTTGPIEKLHIVGGNIALSNDNAGTEINGAMLSASNGGGGDVIFSWLIPGRRWYSGIDTDDAGKWKVATTAGAPSFSTDTKMTIDSSGNVGLGTASPASKLEVVDSSAANGSLAFSFNDNEQPTSLATLPEMFGGSITNNFQIGMRDFALINRNFTSQAGTQGFTFAQQTGVGTFSTLMYMSGDTGNVGIGTTNPLVRQNIFESVNSATQTQLLLQNQGSGNHSAGIGFQVSDSAEYTTYGPKAGLLFERTNPNGRGVLKFMNRGTNDTAGFSASDERMRIDSAGNVGIGTTAPMANLDISAVDSSPTAFIQNTSSTSARYPGMNIVNYSGSTPGYSIISFVNSRGSKAATSPTVAGDTIGSLQAYGVVDTSNTWAYGANISFQAADTFSPTARGTNILFTTTTAGSTTGGERMRIAASGNVGIGTNNPGRTLDVNGIVRATSFEGAMISSGSSNTSSYTVNTDTDSGGSDGGVNFQVRGATKLAVTDGGRVAVGGATTPASLLANTNTNTVDASGTGSSTDSLTWLTNAAGYVQTLTNTSAAATANGLFVKTTGVAATNRILDLNANGTDVMAVTGQGNVGIGTTSPVQRLDVQGTTYAAPATTGSANDGNMRVGSSAHGEILDIGTMGAGTWLQSRLLSNYATNYNLLLNPNGGNVGIGTTSPTSKLDVYGTHGNTAISSVTANGTASALTMGLRYGAVDNAWIIGSGALVLNPSGGNVGIGTASPGTALDVAGTITSRPRGTATGETGQIMMRELFSNGTNTYTLRAPDALTTDRILTFPDSNGSSGNVLSTNGAGVLSWIAPSGGTSFPLLGSNGSVSAPTYSFSGSTGTGIWHNSAVGTGVLSFSNAGTENFRIDANGRVKMGDTSFSYYPRLFVSDSPNGPASSGTTPTSIMRLKATGWIYALDFGIDQAGGNYAWIQHTSSTDQSNTFNLALNPKGGNVGIGTTAPSGKLGVTWTSPSQQGIWIQSTSETYGGSPIVFANSSAGISGFIGQATSSVSYNTTSDRRMKEEIVTTGLSLTDLLKLKVYDYRFIADPKHTRISGFIAQEVQQIYPDAVTTNGDDGKTPLKTGEVPWAVDYGRITPLLTKAIQDLYSFFLVDRERIEKLEAANAQLIIESRHKDKEISMLKAWACSKDPGAKFCR